MAWLCCWPVVYCVLSGRSEFTVGGDSDRGITITHTSTCLPLGAVGRAVGRWLRDGWMDGCRRGALDSQQCLFRYTVRCLSPGGVLSERHPMSGWGYLYLRLSNGRCRMLARVRGFLCCTAWHDGYGTDDGKDPEQCEHLGNIPWLLLVSFFDMSFWSGREWLQGAIFLAPGSKRINNASGCISPNGAGKHVSLPPPPPGRRPRGRPVGIGRRNVQCSLQSDVEWPWSGSR